MKDFDFSEISKWSREKKIIAVVVFLVVVGIFINVVSQSINGSSPASQPIASQSVPIPAQTPINTTTQNVVDNSPAGKLCKKHPTWKPDECQELVGGKLWITNATHPGMTYDMIVYLRGTPNHTNVSDSGNGKSYQYCWDNYTPSCFYDTNDDGRMDAYN